MHPASPVAVAKYGYQKAMKNKVIAIYGAKNRTAIFFNRFISRRLSRSIVYKIQSERKESN
jgi:short-subunit dehydrogenase